MDIMDTLHMFTNDVFSLIESIAIYCNHPNQDPMRMSSLLFWPPIFFSFFFFFFFSFHFFRFTFPLNWFNSIFVPTTYGVACVYHYHIFHFRIAHRLTEEVKKTRNWRGNCMHNWHDIWNTIQLRNCSNVVIILCYWLTYEAFKLRVSIENICKLSLKIQS